jgi:serine/threonine protein kinase
MARDLKLENFLFSDETADSELKMIDFGLSKVSALLLRGLVSYARIYFDMFVLLIILPLVLIAFYIWRSTA